MYPHRILPFYNAALFFNIIFLSKHLLTQMYIILDFISRADSESRKNHGKFGVNKSKDLYKNIHSIQINVICMFIDYSSRLLKLIKEKAQDKIIYIDN